MNPLQWYLLEAGHDLGVEVIAPYTVELEFSEAFTVDALLPELGHDRGMLVAQSSNFYRGLENSLVQAGYGYTSYDEPHAHERYDPVAYAEMFREWRWNATNSHRPAVQAASTSEVKQAIGGYPAHQVRSPEVHPSGGSSCGQPHGHVGPVGPIPIVS